MIANVLNTLITKIEKVFEKNKKGHYIWVGSGENPFKNEEF